MLQCSSLINNLQWGQDVFDPPDFVGSPTYKEQRLATLRGASDLLALPVPAIVFCFSNSDFQAVARQAFP